MTGNNDCFDVDCSNDYSTSSWKQNQGSPVSFSWDCLIPLLTRVMFWTDWGDLKPGIYRSNMDGSAAYRLVSEDVKWPNGISVDSQWVYWTDAYLDCIERITFSGQQRSVILDNLPHPYAIAVFKVSLSAECLCAICQSRRRTCEVQIWGLLGFCKESV